MWLLGIELRTSRRAQSVLLTPEPSLHPWSDNSFMLSYVRIRGQFWVSVLAFCFEAGDLSPVAFPISNCCVC
ncbi:mCG1051045 [Mus musculus]|nr:mCG1051045 [Mus musculus]